MKSLNTLYSGGEAPHEWKTTSTGWGGGGLKKKRLITWHINHGAISRILFIIPHTSRNLAYLHEPNICLFRYVTAIKSQGMNSYHSKNNF